MPIVVIQCQYLTFGVLTPWLTSGDHGTHCLSDLLLSKGSSIDWGVYIVEESHIDAQHLAAHPSWIKYHFVSSQALRLLSSLMSSLLSTMADIADGVTFRTALGHIGFNNATQTTICRKWVCNNYRPCDHQWDILELPLQASFSGEDPNVPVADQVRVPFLALQKLKAMRYYLVLP